MSNQIKRVDAIVKEMRRGWPDGTGHLHNHVKTLLERIGELERGLVRFAHVAATENKALADNPTIGVTPSDANKLVHVYLRDCNAALDLLDSAHGTPVRQDDFFAIPAEG